MKRSVPERGKTDVAAAPGEADQGECVNLIEEEGRRRPIGELDLVDWDRPIGVTLSGTFYGLHVQMPGILESGGARS
ncbi:hypothetical protein [Arthrobacter sp. AZCC_0090]|uniref:hypothetical protein n=1 Tax=Arthrobacter sp. AZCC_0090 TaxID=2735881 RepID=UPI001612317A|nr:hypothetical protein [Arthrobacter sp. AZCC_0090]MBB6407167.1 hypothetical protein [Arthrobacter sp. AZCC_0090]